MALLQVLLIYNVFDGELTAAKFDAVSVTVYVCFYNDNGPINSAADIKNYIHGAQIIFIIIYIP